MSKIYVQIEGNSKGTEVEVVAESRQGLTLRNLNNNFKYRISLRSFERGYKEKQGAQNA